MSVALDPKEVLLHLHSLGYCNISPELLKEFIRDLKKLIRYDEKRGLTSRQRQKEGKYCCQHQEECRKDMARRSCSPEGEDLAAFHTYTRESPTQRTTCQPQEDLCDDESTDGSELSEQNRPNSRVQEGMRKENIPPRPPSSFIRPNSLSGRGKPKSDPVSLYHYYQSIWSQNPQPGQDPRAQLRWNIRHQMMGKQKQQATLSRVASEEKLKSRPEWQS